MGSYIWTCPECGKTTDESTTGSYDFGDEIECPWCGRVSIVSDIDVTLTVRGTTKKVSPTKLQELERIKTEVKVGI